MVSLRCEPLVSSSDLGQVVFRILGFKHQVEPVYRSYLHLFSPSINVYMSRNPHPESNYKHPSLESLLSLTPSHKPPT